MNEQKLSGNPALKNIDPAKLQSLLSMAEQARGKNQSELFSFLMAGSGSGPLKFFFQEKDAIIGELKNGKSPEKKRRIDQMCAMFRQLKK